MNWGVFVCVGLWLTCVSVWLLETGRLQRAFATMAARWRRMPRGQVLTLFVLLVWAVVHGGGKDEQQQEGGQEDAEPPAIDLPVDEPPVDEAPVDDLLEDDLPVGDLPENDAIDPPPAFQMEPDGPMLLTFQGPSWPFDAFTSNAIAGMAATTCPPIPDDMLATGLALYHVATNTVLVEDTDSDPIRAWSRHGADNRGVWVETPFPVTLGTNSYAGVGILANGRLAFGYATYHRQSTNGLPFATPYPVVTLAPLWGPFALLPSAGSAGWTRKISTNRFIVCWENLLLEGDPARPATVQCEIRNDGTIFFLYGSLADGVAAVSTVGVQNLGQGWMYSHGHTNRLVAGMTVTLRPVGPGAWAEADPDNDGISNFDEFMIGTDPLLVDTDGDGPSDFWELNHDFDPIVPQLAPPDPDSDDDGVPDRWEVWLYTPTNDPAVGTLHYLDPDGDGFVSWYEECVLGSGTHNASSPGPVDANHTDIFAVITSARPCVLRLVNAIQTIEIPWMPGVSPERIRLRLTRGQEYLATLSRVPFGTNFTVDGFWWANLVFEAVTNGTTTTPVTANGIVTYYVDTVCIQTPDRGGDFWFAPGEAASATNNLAAWSIEIAWPHDYVFCHTSTNAMIYLAEDSLFDGAIEWLGLPPGTTRTGNPLVFNPSIIEPGLYTVTARCVENRLVTNTVQVEIRNIGVVENTVWLSVTDTNSYTIALSQDTYPTIGVIYTSDPEGAITSHEFTPSSLDPGVYTVYIDNDGCEVAQVTVNVVRVDLDVDTFNLTKFSPPDRTVTEDEGEDIAGVRSNGKHIAANVSDKDGDGIPDYADGYNLDGNVNNADDIVTNELFVPFVLEIPEPINPSVARVRFHYSGSDPALATNNSPAEGQIRIWRKLGNVARSLPDDYVTPDQEYACSGFGLSASSRICTNYIEGIASSANWGDVAITVEVDPGVTNSPGFIATDRVRATIFHAAYVVYNILPYRHDAKTSNRWYAALDTTTPRAYVRGFLDGLPFADPVDASLGWHGGGGPNDPNNLYGHVFSQVVFSGPSIGVTNRYYGKSGTPGLFPFGAFESLQDGTIWWYGINGLQNDQSYCTAFSMNQNRIRADRDSTNTIKLVQQHRWAFADIASVERVRDLCEQHHDTNNPDGVHYERYGLDVDATDCWGGCVVLAGEVVRKLDEDPSYGDLPEWRLWEVNGGWPIIPGTGLWWILGTKNLPKYERTFVDDPRSLVWGTGSSYRTLRWYDTGKIGDWMIANLADTFYVAP